ncbi:MULTISPECIES: CPBP family intramembrane glutamic endopeptidase [Clostridium]|uniref:CPBP family intramembrane glutamic endopeptidase n=1 Tax=Clostridium TaxID=1485 RepID=UPI0008242784|nr:MULTISPECIES: type II CAAX endopeptidase family protein [Clostridium]PJI07862.1 CPBP family intramembrane metalloprotease domain-containing protein [Clostridium sp. CT7]
MKKITKANIFFLVLIIMQLLGSAVIQVVKANFKFNFPSALVISQIILLVIPNIIYILVTRQSFKKTLRINSINIKSVGIVVLIAIFFLPIASFLANLTGLVFKNNVETVIGYMKGTPLIIMVIVLAIVPALCEEFLVRGSILSGYRSISIKKAALINGFLFGVLHLNPPQFLYTFALGIILSYLVYSCDSIFASMTAHFTFNSFSAVGSWYSMKYGIQNTGKSIRDLSTNGKIVTLLIGAILAVVACYIIIVLIKQLMDINKDKIKVEQLEDLEKKENYTAEDKFVSVIPIVLSLVLFTACVYQNLHKIM